MFLTTDQLLSFLVFLNCSKIFLYKNSFFLYFVRSLVLQFAYISRAGACATSAVVLAYHDVLKFLDSSSGSVCSCLRIFRRHSINYLILVFHLCVPRLNFRSVVLWIHNFLLNRKPRVDSHVSTWSSCLRGIPQGQRYFQTRAFFNGDRKPVPCL